MNELQVVFADMHRLKRAVLKLNAGNKNKLISTRADKAILDANAAKTLEQMQAVCDELRWLFKFFMHKEVPDDEALDSTQSGRSASVRRSGETGDRRGDLDNTNVGSQSVPIQDVAAGSDGTSSQRRPSDGLAGALPKRKARKSRAKSRRTVPDHNELNPKDQT